jgi:hypothetical protein
MHWRCHRLDARIVRIDGNVKAELGAHGKHGGTPPALGIRLTNNDIIAAAKQQFQRRRKRYTP